MRSSVMIAFVSFSPRKSYLAKMLFVCSGRCQQQTSASGGSGALTRPAEMSVVCGGPGHRSVGSYNRSDEFEIDPGG